MTTPAKLYGKDLSEYDEVDVDALLAQLSPEEINILAKEVDPDDNFLPPNQRCSYECTKDPTGPLDRKKLIEHINKEALETPDLPELEPYVKGTVRGKKWVPPPRDERELQAEEQIAIDLGEEYEHALSDATQEEIIDLAAILGFHSMMNQDQYHASLLNKGQPVGMGWDGITKSTAQKLYPMDPPNNTDVEESIKRVKEDDPKLIELNLNNIKNISEEKFEQLFDALPQNEHLEVLSLTNVGLTDKTALLLAEAIEKSKTLRVLNVETNFINPPVIVTLVKSLLKARTIEEFRASNQRSTVLGNKIEMEITDLVEKNTSLLRLGLHLEFNDARHRVAAHLQRNIDRNEHELRKGTSSSSISKAYDATGTPGDVSSVPSLQRSIKAKSPKPMHNVLTPHGRIDSKADLIASLASQKSAVGGPTGGDVSLPVPQVKRDATSPAKDRKSPAKEKKFPVHDRVAPSKMAKPKIDEKLLEKLAENKPLEKPAEAKPVEVPVEATKRHPKIGELRYSNISKAVDDESLESDKRAAIDVTKVVKPSEVAPSEPSAPFREPSPTKQPVVVPPVEPLAPVRQPSPIKQPVEVPPSEPPVPVKAESPIKQPVEVLSPEPSAPAKAASPEPLPKKPDEPKLPPELKVEEPKIEQPKLEQPPKEEPIQKAKTPERLLPSEPEPLNIDDLTTNRDRLSASISPSRQLEERMTLLKAKIDSFAEVADEKLLNLRSKVNEVEVTPPRPVSSRMALNIPLISTPNSIGISFVYLRQWLPKPHIEVNSLFVQTPIVPQSVTISQSLLSPIPEVAELSDKAEEAELDSEITSPLVDEIKADKSELEPKSEAPKVDTSQPEASFEAETSKVGTLKADEPKIETPTADEPKIEAPKADEPKIEAPKADETKIEAPKADEPKIEAPKADEPKKEVPKADEPKIEAPKADEPKIEAPKADEPKLEAPRVDDRMIEAPKADLPKAEEQKMELPTVEGTKVEATSPEPPKSKTPEIEIPKAEAQPPKPEVVEAEVLKSETPKAEARNPETPKIEPNPLPSAIEDPANPPPKYSRLLSETTTLAQLSVKTGESLRIDPVKRVEAATQSSPPPSPLLRLSVKKGDSQTVPPVKTIETGTQPLPKPNPLTRLSIKKSDQIDIDPSSKSDVSTQSIAEPKTEASSQTIEEEPIEKLEETTQTPLVFSSLEHDYIFPGLRRIPHLPRPKTINMGGGDRVVIKPSSKPINEVLMLLYPVFQDYSKIQEPPAASDVGTSKTFGLEQDIIKTNDPPNTINDLEEVLDKATQVSESILNAPPPPEEPRVVEQPKPQPEVITSVKTEIVIPLIEEHKLDSDSSFEEPHFETKYTAVQEVSELRRTTIASEGLLKVVDKKAYKTMSSDEAHISKTSIRSANMWESLSSDLIKASEQTLIDISKTAGGGQSTSATRTKIGKVSVYSSIEDLTRSTRSDHIGGYIKTIEKTSVYSSTESLPYTKYTDRYKEDRAIHEYAPQSRSKHAGDLVKTTGKVSVYSSTEDLCEVPYISYSERYSDKNVGQYTFRSIEDLTLLPSSKFSDRYKSDHRPYATLPLTKDSERAASKFERSHYKTSSLEDHLAPHSQFKPSDDRPNTITHSSAKSDLSAVLSSISRNQSALRPYTYIPSTLHADTSIDPVRAASPVGKHTSTLQLNISPSGISELPSTRSASRYSVKGLIDKPTILISRMRDDKRSLRAISPFERPSRPSTSSLLSSYHHKASEQANDDYAYESSKATLDISSASAAEYNASTTSTTSATTESESTPKKRANIMDTIKMLKNRVREVITTEDRFSETHRLQSDQEPL